MARARRARKPALGEKVATAKTRYHSVGPRKVRQVADLIEIDTFGVPMDAVGCHAVELA